MIRFLDEISRLPARLSPVEQRANLQEAILKAYTNTHNLVPMCPVPNPIVMMRHCCSVSLFQDWQQWSTILSYDRKIRLDSQLSRMNCQTFSITLRSGYFGGSGSRVMLAGTFRSHDKCHPA